MADVTVSRTGSERFTVTSAVLTQRDSVAPPTGRSVVSAGLECFSVLLRAP
jgi:hypothetical protein